MEDFEILFGKVVNVEALFEDIGALFMHVLESTFKGRLVSCSARQFNIVFI